MNQPLPIKFELFAGPFTYAMALEAGIGRSRLRRMEAVGRVRRLLRGVYASTDLPDTRALRRSALALVVPPKRLVVGETAAWYWGVDLRERASDLMPIRLARHTIDITTAGGVAVQSPVDLARTLQRQIHPGWYLALLDGLLREGVVKHSDLLEALAEPGRVGELVALADGRARSVAESLLRAAWYQADLPTPLFNCQHEGQELALAAPAQRFAAVVGEPTRSMPQSDGWTLLRLSELRIRELGADRLAERISRSYHQHLQRGLDP